MGCCGLLWVAEQWRSVTFPTGYSLLKKRVGQSVARWGLMKVGGYRKIKRTSY